MNNIYTRLLDELGKHSPLVLATIIRTKGSTPQIAGASALFNSGGLLTGTLGGGLLEADVQARALHSLQEKASLAYEFDLTADMSSEKGAICGGEATILIDAHPEEHTEIFERISQSLSQHQPGVLATFIGKHSEERTSIARHWIEKREDLRADSQTHLVPFQEEIKRSLSGRKSNLFEVKKNVLPGQSKEKLLFLEPIFPVPRLIVAGAGHIGKALCHFGNLLDFEVTVVDDRPGFANKEKLPEADHIVVEDVGKAIRDTPISSDTYIVIVTRGHRSDADALRQCIGSRAAYIGMIGSRRKMELMRKKFQQEGWATSLQFDRVHAPIGIDIQSKTVQEIAVSIIAELILVRRQMQNVNDAV